MTALDVSCQACHGPAARHVAWAEELPPMAPLRDSVDRQLPALASQVEVCAPCHSRRHRISDPARRRRAVPRPLRARAAAARSVLRGRQIHDEVYVWGRSCRARCSNAASFVRTVTIRTPSRCDARATRCARSATRPSRIRASRRSRRAATTRRHHFHVPGSKGAECVACHMPERTYMQVDDRRDHSLAFRAPTSRSASERRTSAPAVTRIGTMHGRWSS